jgi:hypothetical protein
MVGVWILLSRPAHISAGVEVSCFPFPKPQSRPEDRVCGSAEVQPSGPGRPPSKVHGTQLGGHRDWILRTGTSTNTAHVPGSAVHRGRNPDSKHTREQTRALTSTSRLSIAKCLWHPNRRQQTRNRLRPTKKPTLTLRRHITMNSALDGHAQASTFFRPPIS